MLVNELFARTLAKGGTISATHECSFGDAVKARKALWSVLLSPYFTLAFAQPEH